MKIIKIFRGSPITFQNGAHLLGVSLSKIEIIKIASIKTWKISTLSSSSIYVEIVKNLIHQKSLLRFPCCVYICTSSTSNPPSTLTNNNNKGLVVIILSTIITRVCRYDGKRRTYHSICVLITN